MLFLFNRVIFRFHVNFQGCMSFDELKNRSRPEQKKNMFSDSPEFSAMSHGKAIATFRRSITHTHTKM